jgi:hypothetical protein
MRGGPGSPGWFQHPAQCGQALRRLALHRPGRAPEHGRGLLDIQVAVEPQHEGGPLTRRDRGQRLPDVQHGVRVRADSGPVGLHARQQHAPEPRGAPLVEERPDQDRPDVRIGVVHPGCPRPVREQPGHRGLHQIIRTVPVLAQQVGQPLQPGQPPLDTCHILGLAPAHPPPPCLPVTPLKCTRPASGCPGIQVKQENGPRTTRRTSSSGADGISAEWDLPSGGSDAGRLEACHIGSRLTSRAR